ncbi:AraC family transcriptional regulator, partial [Syntrophomonas sp.]|uniref:AraC family transcriptional regulator n=1 Tax=Syntrophomonas sp. TaxID=2053627 RepID=UPI003457CF1C
MEDHWREKYDAGMVAEAANLSKHHFSKLFKKHVGTTPYDYYINIKIREIQERLKPLLTLVPDIFMGYMRTVRFSRLNFKLLKRRYKRGELGVPIV